MIGLNTPANYEYEKVMLAPRSTFFVFDVQTCSDAHIALAENIHDVSKDHVYEIVLGGWSNTKSVIRKEMQGIAMKEKQTPNIVACNATNRFYVSWADGEIKVGKDDPAVPPILEWKDVDPQPVNAVFLSSWSGYVGHWRYDREETLLTTFETHGMLEYNTVWLTPGSDRIIVFKVRVCRDASVVLSSVFGDESQVDYVEIQIGANNNMR